MAEYVLQNAPDGADDKDLIILAIKGAVGPDVTIEETDGTNEVLVIDDAKDIIPLTTKIMSFDYVEDIKVTPLLNGKLKAEAKTSSIVLSNLHTSVVFQKETTNTPFSFISETTDLVGWHIALDWVETYLDNGTNPKLFSQQNVYVEGKLEEGFKISAKGSQFFIGKSIYVRIIAGIDKKTGKGTMHFQTHEP